MKIKSCSVAIDRIEEQDHEVRVVESDTKTLFVNERPNVHSLQKVKDQTITIEGSLTVSF